MSWICDGEKWRAWLVDYSASRARAIEWLGDRYLLAKPINRWPPSGNESLREWKKSEFRGACGHMGGSTVQVRSAQGA
jgi:hypothetical protein